MRYFYLIVIPMVLGMILGASSSDAAEKDYNVKWCNERGGVVPNHAIADGTFPDCITEYYAIEFDYGHKWKEAPGQALNYAMYTGKRAGVVVIVETNRDRLGLERIKKIITHYNLPIDLIDVLNKGYLSE